MLCSSLTAPLALPRLQVSRISGAQGLPMANFTALLAIPGLGVWSGHGRPEPGHPGGLSMHADSFASVAADASVSDRSLSPWRYFHGDRYLPGERVVAVALPYAGEHGVTPLLYRYTFLLSGSVSPCPTHQSGISTYEQL